MAIVFHIPGYLRSFTGGKSRVDLDGPYSTVGEALAALWRLHPGVRDRVVSEQGEVRMHVNVFVGTESIRHTGGLETPLPADSEVSIVPAVSGGLCGRWLDIGPATPGARSETLATPGFADRG